MLRKRDKVKGYLPVIVGGSYLGVLDVSATKLGINLSDYMVVAVGIWACLTVGSILLLEEGLQLFEKSHDNGLEEED